MSAAKEVNKVSKGFRARKESVAKPGLKAPREIRATGANPEKQDRSQSRRSFSRPSHPLRPLRLTPLKGIGLRLSLSITPPAAIPGISHATIG